MLTIAQMFPLDTYAALSFFPWTGSSATSTTVVFSTRRPPATSPPVGQGGGGPGGEDTPLCGCEVAPRSLLHPGDVTWKGDSSFKLRTAEARQQRERWERNIWSWQQPCSYGSQWVYGPMLTRSFQLDLSKINQDFIKISLDWLFSGKNKLLALFKAVSYGSLFLGPGSVLLAWRLPLKQPVSKWAAQHLVHFIKKQNNLEVLTYKPQVSLSWDVLYAFW